MVPALAAVLALAAEVDPYPFTHEQPVSRRVQDVPAPEGFTRVPLTGNPYGAWLRGLPLRAGRPEIKQFNGQPKNRQDTHEATVDLDVGSADLQQCADAVIRLRAEYLWSRGEQKSACFRFTSGHRSPWSDWAAGTRAVVSGKTVRFEPRAGPDSSHASYRRWLNQVFQFAGTASLQRELQPLKGPSQLQPGDVLVQGGFPGHAVTVVDLATHPDGRAAFLVVQSHMPAQDVHLVRNLESPALSPWFLADDRAPVVLPEWTFPPGSARRWQARGCP